MAYLVEELTDIGIQYPVYIGPNQPCGQCVQRIVLASPGSKPVLEPHKIVFVDCIQDLNQRILDDFVLQ